jgi:hypothetical protein
MRIRTILRATLAAVAVAAVTGCAGVSQRAWANGQAMSSSRAYQKAMSGDLSLDTQKRLKAAANPLRLRHREVPYPAFGEWWW